ncbi:CBS domain-containing protein [Nonomuraea rhodomycinica]|uniref:CBS domain-containing protein n=1 Tax=Nonomuraea rhodomycinica TaxID=1712872 RepID=A0A7Y6MEY6_9ACTN|nr:CBS domain-containing protein [Nonomuraea rhodomycinica]NUW44224.1 CBS domain-containing protein [Nonomuraea rhodomycinica]
MALEVKDVMGRVAIAVLEDASFSEIIGAMRRFAVGAVTVIDAERRPVGVVSEDDLLLKESDPVGHSVSMFESHRRHEEHHKAAGVTAGQLMTSPAITVTPDTPLREAARLMRDKRVKQLPVIDPVSGRIAGTLHQQDVLRVFTRPAADLLADIQARIPDLAAYAIEIDKGVVTIRGKCRRRSQAIALEQTIRGIEGVVDVVSELDHEEEDLLVVPPLL